MIYIITYDIFAWIMLLLNPTLLCTSGAHRRFSSLLNPPGSPTRRKDHQKNQNFCFSLYSVLGNMLACLWWKER